MARKDKEIADLKKKTEITETNFKRLRDEVMKLTNALNTKKLSIKQKEERLNILKATQNQ